MDNKIRESLEACRAASDDLLSDDMQGVARELARDAEARLVYDRVQGWDVAIAQSLEQVSVPAGLAERILDRLTEAAPNGSAGLLAESVAAAARAVGAAGDVLPARREAHDAGAWHRRRWAGTAVGGLLVLAMMLALVTWLRQPSDLELDVLAEAWRERLGDQWRPIAEADPDFAVPAVVRVAPTDWQWVDRYTAVPVAAYRLADAKLGQAMLYVANMQRGGLPAAPPVAPQSTTGGRAVAYWQTGDKVYVLVVEQERSYRGFVTASSAPFA